MGTGTEGNRGEQGIQGIPGEPGADGPHGHDGIQGEQGPPGPSSVALLTKSFDTLAAALHQDRRDRRWLAGVAVLVLGLGLLIIVDGRNQARRNGDMMGVMLAVTGCTADDLPACSNVVRDAARSEGTRRIVEVDCLTRRALAGLPAFDPLHGSCLEQTPRHIYPGVPSG